MFRLPGGCYARAKAYDVCFRFSISSERSCHESSTIGRLRAGGGSGHHVRHYLDTARQRPDRHSVGRYVYTAVNLDRVNDSKRLLYLISPRAQRSFLSADGGVDQWSSGGSASTGRPHPPGRWRVHDRAVEPADLQHPVSRRGTGRHRDRILLF